MTHISLSHTHPAPTPMSALVNTDTKDKELEDAAPASDDSECDTDERSPEERAEIHAFCEKLNYARDMPELVEFILASPYNVILDPYFRRDANAFKRAVASATSQRWSNEDDNGRAQELRHEGRVYKVVPAPSESGDDFDCWSLTASETTSTGFHVHVCV